MLYTKMLLIFTQNFLWVGAIIKNRIVQSYL